MNKTRVNIKTLLLFYVCFNMFTLFLYDFGPIRYNGQNSFMLHLLVFIYIVAFVLGALSYSGTLRDDYEIIKKYNDERIMKLLNKCVFINFLLYLVFALNSNGCKSISAFLSRVINGINNPSSLYYDKILNNLSTNNSLSLISYIIYPFMIYVLLASIYNIKKLKTISKIVVGLTVIIEMLKWIGIGTNKGIFDLLILCITIFFIYQIHKDTFREKDNKIKFKYKLLILLGFVSCFCLFNFFITSRLNETSSSFKDGLYNGYKHFSGYLSQGYNGMNLSLSLDWDPTFGLGHSMFLVTQIDKHFDTKIFEHTYQKRAEIYGWSSTVNWHTMYSWIANDFSYFGVIVIMFILGRIMSWAINDFIYIHDYRSLVLFYFMIMMIFYSSANNQVLSTVTSMIAFWYFLFSKIFIRRKRYE